MERKIGRRDFLRLFGFGLGGAVLESCTGNVVQLPTVTTESGKAEAAEAADESGGGGRVSKGWRPMGGWIDCYPKETTGGWQRRDGGEGKGETSWEHLERSPEDDQYCNPASPKAFRRDNFIVEGDKLPEGLKDFQPKAGDPFRSES